MTPDAPDDDEVYMLALQRGADVALNQFGFSEVPFNRIWFRANGPLAENHAGRNAR